MKKSRSLILSIAIFLLAAVFIFSGFVKVIDPLGLEYKLEDYFKAFGMEFFNPMALFFSIALSTTELVLGLCLLLRVGSKPVSLIVFLIMTFFTLLTLVLAITNPVSDCGCFGDAVKLTNWQTFFKNLFLWPLSWYVFSELRFEPAQVKAKIQVWCLILFYAVAISLSLYCLKNQPIVDFLPYKKGVNVAQKLGASGEMSYSQYKTVLYYQRWGVVKAFAPDSIPWQDTTWKFVDSKTELITKGNAPDIDNLSMIDPRTGEDHLHDILQSEYAFLIITPTLAKADFRRLKELNDLTLLLEKKGVQVAALCGDTKQDIEQFAVQQKPGFKVLNTDAVTLKTIIRAYPGYILMHKGTIVSKWTNHSLPAYNDWALSENDFCALSLGVDRKNTQHKTYVLLFAGLVLIGSVSHVMMRAGHRRR